ncbi:MAG: LLM class flavin-dependent oxidoreductase, partial [Chloroflexi bacterium]|nr:LLM class flavin-dependent oxidoreductase [Chloroflexota bacterium]
AIHVMRTFLADGAITFEGDFFRYNGLYTFARPVQEPFPIKMGAMKGPRSFQTAGELAEYGLEPRHLRTIRGAAERESGLVEQVVAPMLRQRGAEARGRAGETARDIGRLTVRLHSALVEARLRQIGVR